MTAFPPTRLGARDEGGLFAALGDQALEIAEGHNPPLTDGLLPR